MKKKRKERNLYLNKQKRFFKRQNEKKNLNENKLPSFLLYKIYYFFFN
jgi:hypothetical protein